MDANQKIQAFEGLLTELSAAMADMVQAANDGKVSTDEIAAALVEMREAIVSMSEGKALSDIAEALKNIKISAPEVVVNVQPAATTIVKPRIARWEFKHEYYNGVYIASTAVPTYEASAK